MTIYTRAEEASWEIYRVIEYKDLRIELGGRFNYLKCLLRAIREGENVLKLLSGIEAYEAITEDLTLKHQDGPLTGAWKAYYVQQAKS